MIDREKVIKGLECCANDKPFYHAHCDECPYNGRKPDNMGGCTKLYRDALELLKEQEKETDRILKVVRDVIYSGVSTDTEPDQDYVYELIRNGVQQSYMERQ